MLLANTHATTQVLQENYLNQAATLLNAFGEHTCDDTSSQENYLHQAATLLNVFGEHACDDTSSSRKLLTPNYYRQHLSTIPETRPSYHCFEAKRKPVSIGTAKSIIHSDTPISENRVRTEGSRYHIILEKR